MQPESEDLPPFSSPEEYDRAIEFMKNGFYSSELGNKVVAHLEWTTRQMRQILTKIACSEHFYDIATGNYRPSEGWCFVCAGVIIEGQRDSAEDQLKAALEELKALKKNLND